MKKITVIGVAILFALCVAFVLIAECTEAPQKGERAQMLDTQKTPTVKSSNERDIFLGYLDQVNNPNNIQWIYCMSWNGQVIFKSTVMGKTISATKSSEPYERVVYDTTVARWDNDAAEEFAGYIPGTSQLMNPSGMFGHDTPGVIWMDPQGNYYEWHEGPYLVSNVPLKLETPVLSYQSVDTEVYLHVQKIEQKLAAKQNLTEEDIAWLNK